MTFEIASIDTSLGEISISVKDLCKKFDIDYDRHVSRAGFNTVYHTELDERDFVLETMQKNFNFEPADTIIFINQSMENQVPGKIPFVFSDQAIFGRVNFFELSDACTGYISGLQLASALLESGQAKLIDLITVEKYSKYIDLANTKISTLFSDSVTISRIVKSKKLKIVGHNTTNSFNHCSKLSLIDSRLDMSGLDIFNWVNSNVGNHVELLISKSGLRKEDIDNWFIHQGSKIVVESIVNTLDIPNGSYFKSADYGNLVSGSMPMLIKNYIPFDKNIEVGKFVVLLTFGVGLTMKSVILENRS
jgi:3-oxoacyl-[acyl-carrier-protein] synthase-3